MSATKPRGPMSDDAYRRWRASVPWTNEQIAQAFEQLIANIPAQYADGYIVRGYQRCIDHARRGHITSRMLSIVLPLLVTTCALCGKKALYRRGNEGRCTAHKQVPERFSSARVARLERLRMAREQEIRVFDARDKARRSVRGIANKGLVRHAR